MAYRVPQTSPSFCKSLPPPTHRTHSWVPPGVTPAYTRPIAGFPGLWHTTTVMRNIEFDPRLGLLTFYPIAEYEALRAAGLANVTEPVALAPGQRYRLGSARQADIEVVIGIPPPGVRAGVQVFADAAGGQGTAVYLETSDFMAGTDLPGDDLHFFGTNTSFGPADCESACRSYAGCKAWTLVRSQPGTEQGAGTFPVPRCCLKSAVPKPHPNPDCVSGVLASSSRTVTLAVDTSRSGSVPGHNNTRPVASVSVPLVAGETALRLRVMLDRSLVEVFAARGRRLITATNYPPAANTHIFLVADATSASAAAGGLPPAVVYNASLWEMGCGWVEAV